jgi:hypothetical protein
LAFFAGIWTRWTSVRKVKEGETTNDIFAFLTTEPKMLISGADAIDAASRMRGHRVSGELMAFKPSAILFI